MGSFLVKGRGFKAGQQRPDKCLLHGEVSVTTREEWGLALVRTRKETGSLDGRQRHQTPEAGQKVAECWIFTLHRKEPGFLLGAFWTKEMAELRYFLGSI